MLKKITLIAILLFIVGCDNSKKTEDVLDREFHQAKPMGPTRGF